MSDLPKEKPNISENNKENQSSSTVDHLRKELSENFHKHKDNGNGESLAKYFDPNLKIEQNPVQSKDQPPSKDPLKKIEQSIFDEISKGLKPDKMVSPNDAKNEKIELIPSCGNLQSAINKFEVLNL